MSRITHAHVFWLGVLANLVAGLIGLVVLGYWRSRRHRELDADVRDALASTLHLGDAPRRRRG